MSLEILKSQAEAHFFSGRYSEGLQTIKECITLSPNNSSLYVSKALHEYQLGRTQQSIQDLNQAILVDYLDYTAYFNLASIQIRNRQLDQAYKNMCCCLSISNLLKGLINKDDKSIQKSVEYCFNNKQARILKSLVKLTTSKKIQALNQINYAIYLDPSNVDIRKVQSRVYKEMGMKQLKAENKVFQKAKYDRLQTNKEVPKEELQKAIQQLVKDFGEMMKQYSTQQIYRIRKQVQLIKVQQSVIYHQKHIIRRIQTSELGQKMTSSVSTMAAPTILEMQKPVVQKVSAQMFAREKDDNISTVNNTINNSNDKNQNSYNSQNVNQLKNEQYVILDSSLSKLGDLSISNISQNSIIKVSKIKNRTVLDVSECFKSFLEAGDNKEQDESHSNTILAESSMDDSQQVQNVELKLPLQTIMGLKENEKIVLAVQKIKLNDKGVNEAVQELYEIVGSKNGFQLVKCSTETSLHLEEV